MSSDDKVPSLADIRREMRAAPGGVLGYLLAKIRTDLDDTSAGEDIGKLERHFLNELRQKGLLGVVFILSALRSVAARIRSRTQDLATAMPASAAAAANALTAVAFAGALFATSVFQATPRAAIAGDLALDIRDRHEIAQSAPQPLTSQRSSTRSATPTAVAAQLSVEVGGGQAGTAAAIKRTPERNIVIDSTAYGWLTPVTGEGSVDKIVTIHCTRSKLGGLACFVLGSVVDALPPPPDTP